LAVKKELFIQSVRLINFDGQVSIPTAIRYDLAGHVIGPELETSGNTIEKAFDDFKIQLGDKKQREIKLALDNGAATKYRSPLKIAKDFFDATLGQVENVLESRNKAFPSKILVAEPLALSGNKTEEDEWLVNYRASLRRILHGKFAELDFLPEPFAVFQYYRYGLRTTLLTQQKKHIALVVDFGGGTFDVCVIETTAQGDIAKGGRGSKPFAATSAAVGGFEINKQIAEYLLFSVIERRDLKEKTRKAIRQFEEWKFAAHADLEDYSEANQKFFNYYRNLLDTVEKAKIFISTSVVNWNLDNKEPSKAGYPIQIALDPFNPDHRMVEVRFDANIFKNIFEDRIWKEKLFAKIEQALKRASRDLDGKSVSVALLSGGSASIGWLKQLMLRDFAHIFKDIEILQFSKESQEIVAKGLAIECARRFHTGGEGDFRATTYNRLCLVLNPNDTGNNVKAFNPISPKTMDKGEQGVLIPSSTNLRSIIEQPLRWRVQLSKPPTQHLDYYFLRSTNDPNDIEARQNIIEHRIFTRRGTKIGNAIEVELNIRSDGTASPKFYYNNNDETGVDGQPFYLDMTFAAEESEGSNYLGFDFGTSTTSVSYVDQADIEEFKVRASDQNWLEISDLAETLPYPISHPLAWFLHEQDAENQSPGRAVIEAMLSVAASIMYSEFCAESGTPNTKFFSSFRKRSAGPLWHLIKQLTEKLSNNPHYSKKLVELFRSEFSSDINHCVNNIAIEKHDKKGDHINYQRVITIFGNAFSELFKQFSIGFFQDSTLKPFEDGVYEGSFRSLVGKSPPFIYSYSYEGPANFDGKSVYLIDAELGETIKLSPFLMNGLAKEPSGNLDEIHLLDLNTEAEISYKGVQRSKGLNIREEESFKGLVSLIESLNQADKTNSKIINIQFKQNNQFQN
jgi:hypothetical protein